MDEILIVAIVFGSITACVMLVCLVPVWIIKILRGGNLRNSSKQEQQEEARLAQELYKGLSRMESRIEALETILLDRKKSNYEQL